MILRLFYQSDTMNLQINTIRWFDLNLLNNKFKRLNTVTLNKKNKSLKKEVESESRKKTS